MAGRIKQWSWIRKTIFGSFALAIITGLFTNAITPFFFSTIQFVFEFVLANLGWVITLIILLVITPFINFVGSKASKEQIKDMNKKLIEAGNETSRLSTKVDFLNTDLDKNKQLLFFVEHSLLKRLSEVLSVQDVGELDQKMHEFMKVFLADATVFAPKVYAASLFLPSPNEKDYLTIWMGYQVPEDSKARARCYIGSESGRKRGIAGEAYIQRKLIVARQILDDDAHWKFDNDDYIHFPKPTTYPPFMSLVCVPIVQASLLDGSPSKPLGALCFDSESVDSFNSPTVQNILKQLGQYTASVLLLYYKVRESYFS